MQKFRKAFVLEKKKFAFRLVLLEVAEEIVFLLEGDERGDEISHKLQEGLKSFDNSKDVIIPTGRGFVSLLLGYMLSRTESFNLGIYENRDYKFLRIFSNELERIITDATV